MKFICSQTKLMEALNNVTRAVPPKSTIPALEGIKLMIDKNVLELTGYDLELGIQTKIEVSSDDYGEVIVNAKLFTEIVRKMDSDTITISIDDKLKMTISGATAEYNILALSADDYPALPDYDTGDSFNLPQSLLKNMINQTIFAVAVDDKKPVLMGELFDIQDGSFNLVAIDGYRLAVRHEKLDTDNRYNFVVKGKALQEVAKLLKDDDKSEEKHEVILHVSKRHVIFEVNGYMVISRLLEGDFHNYKASIPQNHTTEIVLKTKDIISSLERCSLLINEKMKAPVKCLFDAGQVKISCSTALGKLSDEFDVEISGNMVEIGFNCRYLLEAMKATESDKVKLYLNGGLAPMKVLPLEGDAYTFLVLPVRLKTE
ncbi:MAG: DNA polymerase III subunit beta [Oscillospiraceae bacterium]|nr:DNA polymerase III subunit beta [Oscillospiraceae bacterium]